MHTKDEKLEPKNVIIALIIIGTLLLISYMKGYDLIGNLSKMRGN